MALRKWATSVDNLARPDQLVLGGSRMTQIHFRRMTGRRRALSILFAALVILTGTAKPSPAQTSDGDAALPGTSIPLAGQTIIPPASALTGDPSELPKRMAESQQWVREYSEWKEWEDQWRGKLEPGWFGPRERRIKPDPPAWLFDVCLDLADAEAARTDACRMLAEWQESYTVAEVRAKMQAARTQGEASSKRTWWRHVHIDALWLTPNASVSYGVVGVHVTLNLVGRWQMFAAPGAMLLNVPAPDGRRAWRPATDLGLSYRLADIRLPGSRRQGTLHLNVAKAWLLGGSESFINSSVDLAGLSITFK